jgi:ClpP class serine protease
VYAQRGDRLVIDREMLASGEVFMGLQALQMGLIDDLGSGNEAVSKAAQMAHLAHYQTFDVNRALYGDRPSEELAQGRQLADLIDRQDVAWRQKLYYLYVEPERRTR